MYHENSKEKEVAKKLADEAMEDHQKLGGQPQNVGGLEAEAPAVPYEGVLLTPEVPVLANTKTISLSITEDIEIKDVLIELARLAELEIAIDPKIEGGIILKVKDRSINEVIGMIAKQASLRYTVNNGLLTVERDTPYTVNYKLNYPEGIMHGAKNGHTTEDIDGLWRSIDDNLSKLIEVHTDSKSREEESKPFYIVNRYAGIISVVANSKIQQSVKKYLNTLEANIHTS